MQHLEAIARCAAASAAAVDEHSGNIASPDAEWVLRARVALIDCNVAGSLGVTKARHGHSDGAGSGREPSADP